MALNLDLQKTVDAVLTEFAPTGDKSVYSRILSKSGGDALLNIGVTVISTDALLSPQPVYRKLDLSDVNLLSTKNVSLGDYEFVISLNSITKASLLDKNTLLVLKDSSGNEDVLCLTGFDAIGVSGADVVFIGYYKAIKRG